MRGDADGLCPKQTNVAACHSGSNLAGAAFAVALIEHRPNQRGPNLPNLFDGHLHQRKGGHLGAHYNDHGITLLGQDEGVAYRL